MAGTERVLRGWVIPGELDYARKRLAEKDRYQDVDIYRTKTEAKQDGEGQEPVKVEIRYVPPSD